MWRQTTAVVVALTGSVFAAPRLKEQPKKAESLVGTWRLVQMDGAKTQLPLNIEYLADRTMTSWSRDPYAGTKGRYTTDTSASPAQLDYLYDHKPPDLCIFKVEGDTLTVCYNLGQKTRPKEFGPQPGARQLTFERVKPKE